MPLKGSLEAFPLLSSAEFRVCTKPEEAWELPGGVNEQCQGWDTSSKQEGIPDLDTERAKGGQKPKGACVFSKSLRWAHITLAKNDSLTSQLCARVGGPKGGHCPRVMDSNLSHWTRWAGLGPKQGPHQKQLFIATPSAEAH